MTEKRHPALSRRWEGIGVWVALLLLSTISAHAQAPTRAQMLDRMFGALQAAPDEQSAGQIEQAITSQLIDAASPAVKLLLARGLRELGETPQDALDDFNATLDLDPTLVEGWHSRALAHASLGDTAAAESDIAHAIQLEPRNFAAFVDLSRIAEQHKDWRGAMEAEQKALETDPKTPGGAERLKDLQRRVFGEPT
jgi:tetratricopeptide (TPR) repeat protein